MKAYHVMAVEKGRVELVEKAVEDPKPWELQVRVHTTLISPGTERALILGMENTFVTYPLALGYSAVGTVEKIGSEVKGFEIGERVACFCLNHCALGNVSAEFCIQVDSDIPDEQAVFLALGVICLQGIRKVRLELGESVLVQGMGPIGLLALMLARTNGALPLIGLDKVQSRLELAKQIGADFVIQYGEPQWEEELKQASGGEGPKVVIESTGFAEPINTALEVACKFGRVALLGSTRGATTVNFYTTIHKKVLTVTGANIMGNPVHDSRPGFWTWRDDAKAFLELLKYGRINAGHLISEQVGWKDSLALYGKLLEWNADMIVPLIHWR